VPCEALLPSTVTPTPPLPPSLCPSLPSLLVVSMERIASQFVKTPSSSDPSQLHFYHAGKQEDACGSELRAMTHKGARNYQHKAY